MGRLTKQLFLTVEQAGKVSQHRLSNQTRFTIGKHPGNDVTIYGDEYPDRHTLFTKKNNSYQLTFKKFMTGEVEAGESRLKFKDMIVHNLLPRKDDSYFYPLTQDKKGFVIIADAKISFQFVGADGRDAVLEELLQFKGYSWLRATLKDLRRDPAFKAILLVIAVAHALFLNYLGKLPVDLTPKLHAIDVPERFAKFIVKSPEAGIGEDIRSAARSVEEGGEEESSEPAAQKQPAEKGGKQARPESQGVLGLLTGLGSSSQASPLTDLLLDKGLVKELDAVMTNTDLQVGKGASAGDGLDLDNLFAAGEGAGGSGIDDIVGELDGVESVNLGEKGQIQLDQIGGMKGSGAALGKRSEDSVRQVMLSYTGRLTYIYNKYLKHNPALQGKLVVEVVIAADGSVNAVKIVSSNMNQPEFEREVVNFIRKWKYAPIDEGTVTVNYPLFFNKIG
jgi:TonB family protein